MIISINLIWKPSSFVDGKCYGQTPGSILSPLIVPWGRELFSSWCDLALHNPLSSFAPEVHRWGRPPSPCLWWRSWAWRWCYRSRLSCSAAGYASHWQPWRTVCNRRSSVARFQSAWRCKEHPCTVDYAAKMGSWRFHDAGSSPWIGASFPLWLWMPASNVHFSTLDWPWLFHPERGKVPRSTTEGSWWYSHFCR